MYDEKDYDVASRLWYVGVYREATRETLHLFVDTLYLESNLYGMAPTGGLTATVQLTQLRPVEPYLFSAFLHTISNGLADCPFSNGFITNLSITNLVTI